MAINTLHKVTLTEGQIGVILCSLEKSVKYATNKYITENIDEIDSIYRKIHNHFKKFH